MREWPIMASAIGWDRCCGSVRLWLSSHPIRYEGVRGLRDGRLVYQQHLAARALATTPFASKPLHAAHLMGKP